MGKGLEQTLLQGRHTEGPETYEKMLSITSHQRDANYNHNEVPSQTNQSSQHKQINKQMLERMWSKRNPSALLLGMQTGRPLWKTVWDFLRKLKMELPFDPAIPLLGLYPKNPETTMQKNLCTPMFIEAQFTIAKYWKQTKCPSANEWIQKLWYIYTMGYYAAEREKQLLPFEIAWMELESIMLCEISQAVRDKYHMISPLTGT